MKPSTHTINSIKRYGGSFDDYIKIHEWLDQTKAAHGDMRHRAILHNTMGPFIAADVFGITIQNSEGKDVDVRQICEDHIIEDLGYLPNISDFLDLIPIEEMGKFAIKKGEQHFQRVD